VWPFSLFPSFFSLPLYVSIFSIIQIISNSLKWTTK
jgi:hypothetical protein